MPVQPPIIIREAHSLAGTFVPQPGKRYANTLMVVATHSKTRECADGCGALGNLSPQKAEAGVKDIFGTLEAYNLNPHSKEWFGMEQHQLVTIVKEINFETDASVRAKRLMEDAKVHNLPVVAVKFGHVDGSMEVIASHGLEKLDKSKPIDVIGSVCSDAREPSEVLLAGAKCALSGSKSCSHPNMVAKVPESQHPSEILVYGKDSHVPDKNFGEVFTVSVDPQKGADLAAKLSVAFALRYGKNWKGPQSLVRIRFQDAGKAEQDLRKAFTGVNGIDLV